MTSPLPTLPPGTDVLCELGFARVQDRYVKPGWELRRVRGWWRLARPWPGSRESFDSAGPGLWKRAGEQEVFEWPEAMSDPEADPDDLVRSMLSWAWETAAGALQREWSGLDRAEVETWCDGDQYTIGRGHLLRQVELRCEPGLLALETPIVQIRNEELPEPRRDWLRRMALATQEQWPMLRLRADPSGAWWAEVNLTGAPLAAARSLFSTGLASLRGAVRSLAEGAELLADVTVASEALARSRGNNSEG